MAEPAEPARPRRRLRAAARELGVILGLYVFYCLARGLARGDLSTADLRGSDLLRWEQKLHLAPEHLLNSAVSAVTAVAVTTSYFYVTLHYLVTAGVMVWLYRRRPVQYLHARRVLVLGTLIAMVFFLLLPTAPPRLLPGDLFTDTLAQVSHFGWWGDDASAPRGLGGLTNQVAALPSLHVGWAVWCGFLVHRYARHRLVRVAGVVYPVLTTLVVLATGNHYLVDAVAGGLVMGVAALVLPLLEGLPVRLLHARRA